MKPCRFSVKHSMVLLQPLPTGLVVAKIKGSVKKLGNACQNANVVLYNKANLQLIAVTRPDENGDYYFLGLNNDLKTFVVAFDQSKKYNAVIQDNVVPK